MKWLAVLLLVTLAIEGLQALTLEKDVGISSVQGKKRTRHGVVQVGASEKDGLTLTNKFSLNENAREDNKQNSRGRTKALEHGEDVEISRSGKGYKSAGDGVGSSRTRTKALEHGEDVEISRSGKGYKSAGDGVGSSRTRTKALEHGEDVEISRSGKGYKSGGDGVGSSRTRTKALEHGEDVEISRAGKGNKSPGDGIGSSRTRTKALKLEKDVDISSVKGQKKTRYGVGLEVGVSKEDGLTLNKEFSREENARVHSEQNNRALTKGNDGSEIDSQRIRSQDIVQNNKKQDSQQLGIGGTRGDLLRGKQFSEISRDETKNNKDYNQVHYSKQDRNGGNTRNVDAINESGNERQTKSSSSEESSQSFGLGNGGLESGRSGSQSQSNRVVNKAFRRNQRIEDESLIVGGSTRGRNSKKGSSGKTEQTNTEEEDSSVQSSYTHHTHPQGSRGSENQESLIVGGSTRGRNSKKGSSEKTEQTNTEEEDSSVQSSSTHHTHPQGSRGSENQGVINSGGNQDGSVQYDIKKILGSPGTPVVFQRDRPRHGSHSPNYGSSGLYQNDNYGSENGNFAILSGSYGGEGIGASDGHNGRHTIGGWKYGQNYANLLRGADLQRGNNFEGGLGFQGANSAEYINQNHASQFNDENDDLRGLNQGLKKIQFESNTDGQIPNSDYFDSENIAVDTGYPRSSSTDNIPYARGNGYGSNSKDYLNKLNHARGTVNYPGTASPRQLVNRGFIQGRINTGVDQSITPIDDDNLYLAKILNQAQRILTHHTIQHTVPNKREPVHGIPYQGIGFYDEDSGSHMSNPSSGYDDDAVITSDLNTYQNGRGYVPSYYKNGVDDSFSHDIDESGPTTIYGRSPGFNVPPVVPVTTIPVDNDKTGKLIDRTLAFASMPLFDKYNEGTSGDASDAADIIIDRYGGTNSDGVSRNLNEGLIEKSLNRDLRNYRRRYNRKVDKTLTKTVTGNTEKAGVIVKEDDITYKNGTSIVIDKTTVINNADKDGKDKDKKQDKINNFSGQNNGSDNKDNDKNTEKTKPVTKKPTTSKNSDKDEKDKEKTVDKIKKGSGQDHGSNTEKAGVIVKEDDRTIKNGTSIVIAKTTVINNADKDGKDKDKQLDKIKNFSGQNNGSDNKNNDKTTENTKPVTEKSMTTKNSDKDGKDNEQKDNTVDKNKKVSGTADELDNTDKGNDTKTKSDQSIINKSDQTKKSGGSNITGKDGSDNKREIESDSHDGDDNDDGDNVDGDDVNLQFVKVTKVTKTTYGGGSRKAKPSSARKENIGYEKAKASAPDKNEKIVQTQGSGRGDQYSHEDCDDDDDDDYDYYLSDKPENTESKKDKNVGGSKNGDGSANENRDDSDSRTSESENRGEGKSRGLNFKNGKSLTDDDNVDVDDQSEKPKIPKSNGGKNNKTIIGSKNNDGFGNEDRNDSDNRSGESENRGKGRKRGRNSKNPKYWVNIDDVDDDDQPGKPKIPKSNGGEKNKNIIGSNNDDGSGNEDRDDSDNRTRESEDRGKERRRGPNRKTRKYWEDDDDVDDEDQPGKPKKHKSNGGTKNNNIIGSKNYDGFGNEDRDDSDNRSGESENRGKGRKRGRNSKNPKYWVNIDDVDDDDQPGKPKIPKSNGGEKNKNIIGSNNDDGSGNEDRDDSYNRTGESENRGKGRRRGPNRKDRKYWEVDDDVDDDDQPGKPKIPNNKNILGSKNGEGSANEYSDEDCDDDDDYYVSDQPVNSESKIDKIVGGSKNGDGSANENRDDSDSRTGESEKIKKVSGQDDGTDNTKQVTGQTTTTKNSDEDGNNKDKNDTTVVDDGKKKDDVTIKPIVIDENTEINYFHKDGIDKTVDKNKKVLRNDDESNGTDSDHDKIINSGESTAKYLEKDVGSKSNDNQDTTKNNKTETEKTVFQNNDQDDTTSVTKKPVDNENKDGKKDDSLKSVVSSDEDCYDDVDLPDKSGKAEKLGSSKTEIKPEGTENANNEDHDYKSYGTGKRVPGGETARNSDKNNANQIVQDSKNDVSGKGDKSINDDRDDDKIKKYKKVVETKNGLGFSYGNLDNDDKTDSEDSGNKETFIDGQPTVQRRSKDDKLDDRKWKIKKYRPRSTVGKTHDTKTQKDLATRDGRGYSFQDFDGDTKNDKNGKSTDLFKKTVTRDIINKIPTKNGKFLRQNVQSNDDDLTDRHGSRKVVAVNTNKNGKTKSDSDKESTNNSNTHKTTGGKKPKVSDSKNDIKKTLTRNEKHKIIIVKNVIVDSTNNNDKNGGNNKTTAINIVGRKKDNRSQDSLAQDDCVDETSEGGESTGNDNAPKTKKRKHGDATNNESEGSSTKVKRKHKHVHTVLKENNESIKETNASEEKTSTNKEKDSDSKNKSGKDNNRKHNGSNIAFENCRGNDMDTTRSNSENTDADKKSFDKNVKYTHRISIVKTSQQNNGHDDSGDENDKGTRKISDLTQQTKKTVTRSTRKNASEDIDNGTKNDKTDKLTDVKKQTSSISGSDNVKDKDQRFTSVSHFTNAGLNTKPNSIADKASRASRFKTNIAKVTIKIQPINPKKPDVPSDNEDSNHFAGDKTTTDSTSGKTRRTEDEQGKTQSENCDEENSTSKNKFGQSSYQTSGSSTFSSDNNNEISDSTSNETTNSIKRTEESSQTASGNGSGSEQEFHSTDGEKITYTKHSDKNIHLKQKKVARFNEETTDSNGTTIGSGQSYASKENNNSASDSYAEESDDTGNVGSKRVSSRAGYENNQEYSSSASKTVNSEGNTNQRELSSSKLEFSEESSVEQSNTNNS